MFEWNEEHEQDKGTRKPAMLAMPQQAPPVNRIRSAPTNPEDGSGVEASFGWKDLANILI